MEKKKVLFVCIHNSARSQMAEEILRQLAGSRFDVESAGLEPGKLNLFAVEVLKEIGIDISDKKTQAAADLIKAEKKYHYVVTVCDEASAEQCPNFPGIHERLHWGFEDPSRFAGSDGEKLNKTREVREQIKLKIEEWLRSHPAE